MKFPSESILLGAGDWLATYALHSTVALSLVLLVGCALRRRALPFQELLLRLALVLPLLSSLLQFACQLAPVAFSLPVLADTVLALPGFEWPGPGREAIEPSSVAAAVPAAGQIMAEPASPAGTDLRPWLLVAAAFMAVLGLLGLLRCFVRLRGWLVDREPEQDRRVLGFAAELAQQAGLRQTPQLSRSPRLPTPVALGLLRPEICLPLAASDLDDDSLRALLAHELAHLRRADPMWLCLRALLQALFPWQLLFVAWQRRWSLLSELQCDAAAVQHTSPTAVARCLLDVAGWLRPPGEALPLASAMAARPSMLRLRVEAALAAGQPWHQPRGLRLVASLASLLALVLGVPSVGGPVSPVLPSQSTSEVPGSSPAVALASPGPLAAASTTAAAAVAAEFAALSAEVAELRRNYAGRRPDPKIERMLVLLSQRLLVLEQLQARLEAKLQLGTLLTKTRNS